MAFANIKNVAGGAQFARGPSLKDIGFPWHMLVFCGFLFGFSVFIWLGLTLGYGSYVKARIAAVDKDIQALSAQVDAEEQENLTTFYSQLVNLDKVLKEHAFSVNVLPFLEETTIARVFYTGARFSLKDLYVSLSGKAVSVPDVVGQLAVLDERPEVERVELQSLTFGDFDVSFTAGVDLKRDFFEKLF